ncbi:hypothetical protein H2204_010286 [Knufia peltigerae]|uniref:Cytochrome P450 n=1 Tax=Knufia peltigerae TaxID=1002370 RepID=A0AA38XWI7_9EURO|nr:hypothetical protein H2204_010286 [Knufia peltigerae]
MLESNRHLTVSPSIAAAAAGAAGLIWHRVYNRSEPTIRSFARDLCLTEATFIAIAIFGAQTALQTGIVSVIFFFAYLGTLGTSIAVYRLFFHPLRKFPGPWQAKLTKWTGVRWATSGELHFIVQAQHEKYGDVVRTGPNELSFASIESIKDIHGANANKITRGPYNYPSPYGAAGLSMPNTRSHHEHKARRRLWDGGLTMNQVRSYEPRVVAQCDILCSVLREYDGQVVDMKLLIDWLTFDIMGDLAFSKSFGMMHDGGPRYYTEAVRRAIRLRNTIGQVPWMSTVSYLLPVDPEFRKKAQKFTTLSKAIFDERKAKGTEPNDIFSYILASDKDGAKTADVDVEADAPSLVIAGSDTSSVTATFLFYFVTRNKSIYSGLSDEIDRAWDGKSPMSSDMLNPDKCPILHGCICEALRIWPPGPNHSQRRTEDVVGHQVGDDWIPPETQLSVHIFTVQRNPKHFTNPLEFVPERWIDSKRDPTWAHNTRAWIPFQAGAYACAGKQLALNELRVIMAKIMRKFKITMKDDFDHKAFNDKIKSFQSLVMGELPLLVEERKD